MARRIIALDIGSHTLKAAVIESSLRRCHVAGLFQRWRDPDRPLAEQLQDFREEHGLQADTVLSCLPGDTVSLRLLQLPFTKHRQIEQTAPFELGDQIPFDLDSVMADFYVLQRTPQGATVLAIAVPTSTLTEHLETLAAAGFDPTSVGVIPLAPIALLQLAKVEWRGTQAVLNIGAKNTDIVLLQDGMLRGLRTLSLGLNHGEGFSSLIQQLRWTLLALGGPDGAWPERCFISGGGARSPQLCLELEQTLAADITAFHELSLPMMPLSLQSDQDTYAVCLGLGLQEAFGLTSPTVNLRRGSFTHQGQREALRSEFSRLGWLAVGVAAAASLTFTLDMYRLQMRYAALQQEIRRVFTTTLPDVHTIVSEKVQLHDAVETLQKRQQLLQGATTISPLELLRQLSAAVPEQIHLDLDEWLLESDAIRLRGSTTSFDAAETIKTAAVNLGVFHDVQLKDVKMTSGGAKVAFGLQLSLQKDKQESSSKQQEAAR